MLVRTTNDGRTWQPYPFAGSTSPVGYPGTFGPIDALSDTSAAIVLDYPTGHGRTQIMVGRAIGPDNQPSFIKLPPGVS